MQIVEEASDDEEDDIDAALKKEVAEAIIAAMEIDTIDDKENVETVEFADVNDDDAYEYDDSKVNVDIPEHLKDKSLMELKALEVDISTKDNENVGTYVYTSAYLCTYI